MCEADKVGSARNISQSGVPACSFIREIFVIQLSDTEARQRGEVLIWLLIFLQVLLSYSFSVSSFNVRRDKIHVRLFHNISFERPDDVIMRFHQVDHRTSCLRLLDSIKVARHFSALPNFVYDFHECLVKSLYNIPKIRRAFVFRENSITIIELNLSPLMLQLSLDATLTRRIVQQPRFEKLLWKSPRTIKLGKKNHHSYGTEYDD